MDAVTGAFSYTGRSIPRRLLEAGREVRTLTGHPSRPDPFGGKVSVVPYAFDDAAALAAGLRGAEVLYNTYWVRFPYRGVAFDQALRNTRALLQGAEEAGVPRVVHISITNPSRGPPVAGAAGRRPRLVHLPPTLLIGLVKVLGLALGDVLLTVDELRGLMAGLVATEGPPTGGTRLSEWLDEHAGDIGRVYASELA